MLLLFLLGGQRRIIIGILREVERLVEISELRKFITRWRGWTRWLAIGGIVIGAWSRGIELVIDACQRGQAKPPFNELQNRTVFVQLARNVAAPRIG